LKKEKISKLFFAMSFMLSLCLPLSSQTAWQPQTSGVTKDLYGLNFIDSQTGWVVGTSGTILKTTDGGNSWQSLSSGVTSALAGIHFLNSNLGWVVGDLGKILKTTDGGNTWSTQSLGITVSGDLRDVFFINSSTGFIAGTYGVYKTTNGGTTWALSHTSNSSQINDVFFKDANNGWSVGLNGKIRNTVDGGTSWTQVNPSLNSDFYAVHATGTAVFTGGFKNEIIRISPSSSASPTTSLGGNVHDICFVGDNNGWLCGDYGKIYTTSDGGNTWNASPSGSTKYLRGIQFTSSNQGWAVGYSGTILKYVGINSPTSVRENTESSRASVFPNPASQEINITLDAALFGQTYSIVAIDGSEKSTGMINNNDLKIDVSGYPEGVYFFKTNGLVSRIVVLK
jgi:photosystem II stability/assembly factor-like uncharacterized protein